MDPATRNDVLHDFLLAQEDFSKGVAPETANSIKLYWSYWLKFCSSLSIDPLQPRSKDPVILLQVFARRYRTGALPHQRKAVRKDSVDNALRAIGQTCVRLGTKDPRLNEFGVIDFRLTRQLNAYQREDPPPDRVKPIPFQVILYLATTAFAVAAAAEGTKGIADMIILAFFFLLRPGEYTSSASKKDSAPFRLMDVCLRRGHTYIDVVNCAIAELDTADFCSLTFSTQKNGVKNEKIGHVRSGHHLCCPVAAIIRRVKHLRAFNASPDTPLSQYFSTASNCWCKVQSKDITASLRQAVIVLNPTALGFETKDIEARSLRSGGAMALLCGNVDTDKIRLLGRWKSDAMLRYLHVQALPLTYRFSERMIAHGNFTLYPGVAVPQAVLG